MDNNTFERLLNENESTSLDFKKEQYLFERSNDFEKSELLKDILAFANSWRRTDAYILIGVEEVIGGRNKTIGVISDLDDSSIQQFVNSKTQKPITFDYSTYIYEGKKVGILHLPLQSRPYFLKIDYGHLKKNQVYIRRGSSTDIALPDEIAKMGAAFIGTLADNELDLQFANISTREALGRSRKTTSKVLKLPNGQNIPEFKSQDKYPYNTILNSPNKKYYRHLFEYYEDLYLLNKVGFMVTNNSPITANNLKLIISEKKKDFLKVLLRSDIAPSPIKYNSFLPISENYLDNQSDISLNKNFSLQQHGSKWTLEIDFGNIQPKSTIWSPDVIYIGSTIQASIILNASLFADNLPNPITIPLFVEFVVEDVIIDIYDLDKVHEEKFEEYKKSIENDEF